MTESSETSCNEAKTYLIIGTVISVMGTIAGIAGLLFAARSWGCFNTLTVPSSSKKPGTAKSGVSTEDNPAYSVSLSLQYQGTVGELGCLCGKAGTSHLCDGSAHSSGCVVNGSNAMAAV